MLFKIIKSKEQELDALNKKLSRRESFSHVSFQEKLDFIDLKLELAQLHLLAAKLAKNQHCHLSYGKHLKMAFDHNPDSVPKLLPSISPVLPLIVEDAERIIERREMVDAYVMPPIKFLGVLTLASTMGALAVAGLLYRAAVEFPATVTIELYAHTAERAAHALYVTRYCLSKVPTSFNAQDCFFNAMGNFNDGDFYLSIKYLLEADVRLENENPEISYFFVFCLVKIIKQLYGHIRFIPGDRTGHTDANLRAERLSILVQNLERIKKNVLENAPLQLRESSYIWSISPKEMLNDNGFFMHEFCEGFETQLTKNSPQLVFSLPGIIINFHRSLYRTYPHIKPPDYNSSLMDGSFYYQLKGYACQYVLPLIEITAYMSRMVTLPDSYIHLGINSRIDHNQDIEADSLLYSLILSNEGVELKYLHRSTKPYSVELVSEYIENLALVLDQENCTDCEVLQKTACTKYWLALHTKIDKTMSISWLPLYLRNPLVYIKEFIDENFDKGSMQHTFFNNLLETGSDLASIIHDRTIFSNYRIYESNKKSFFMMLELLAQLGVEKLQEFINEMKASVTHGHHLLLAQ